MIKIAMIILFFHGNGTLQFDDFKSVEACNHEIPHVVAQLEADRQQGAFVGHRNVEQAYCVEVSLPQDSAQ